MTEPAVLRPGSTGEPVRDLQRRLAARSHRVPATELGSYGAVTEQAVRSFQEARGLRVDGICGNETWAALVESGWKLGDRFLYLRRPMLRGDDVAALQQHLNALGFDAGREDGIFGGDTAGALTEFQRNSGLTPDGICGPSTLAQLARVGTWAGGSVASLRERELLRDRPHDIDGQRIFVAADPGFEAVARAVALGLGDAGAEVIIDTAGSDDQALAAEANRAEAQLFFALRPGDSPGSRCSYYESGRFRSESGYRVATAVAAALTPVFGGAAGVCGRTVSALRETRMAAVLCEPLPRDDVASLRALVAASGEVAQAIVAGIRAGMAPPTDLP